MIALLEPIFRGKWAAYGETLVCGMVPDERDPQQVALLADFLADEKLLDGVLMCYARHLKCHDLRPVASAWMLDYCSALLPPVVAAASVLQHGFPLSPAEIALVLDARGSPVAFRIPHQGASLSGRTTAERYAVLVWEHLAPLIERLAQRTPASPRLLWANAARYFDEVLEQAILVAQDASGVSRDRDTLLHQPTWPDGRANPLFGKSRATMKAVDGEAVTLRLHRQCCLYYLLPDQGYCRACPRTSGNRRVRARNGE